MINRILMELYDEYEKENIRLVEEWIEFYNTTRIKGKKVNKKKGYNKNDK